MILVNYNDNEFYIKDNKINEWNELLKKNNNNEYGKHILSLISDYCWCLEMCMKDGTSVIEAYKITNEASNNWNMSGFQYNQMFYWVKELWYKGDDL